jgi:proteasome lid subunit RPN8/RPN11
MLSPSFQQLRVPAPILDEMLAQALAERPHECCGLLAGTCDAQIAQVVARYPLVNAAASSVACRSDERGTIAATRAIRERGLAVLAVYHSHPLAPPVPSQADLADRYGEDVVHFIVSLATTPPTVRAWWLTATDYRPADWRTG